MNHQYPGLPIDPEILEKRKQIPVKIAELSYLDQESAIEFIRIFGEHKMPITTMFDELSKCLEEKAG
ncbi:MAG: hypothetical protein K0Q56_2001 [Sporolactobacillus laevolacticus]|jgi:hypothetical protein|nr:hypothetical protein [Sporolactobacillus laevolacticus]